MDADRLVIEWLKTQCVYSSYYFSKHGKNALLIGILFQMFTLKQKLMAVVKPVHMSSQLLLSLLSVLVLIKFLSGM